MSDLGITLEFGGGAELLVGKVKRHEVTYFLTFKNLNTF